MKAVLSVGVWFIILDFFPLKCKQIMWIWHFECIYASYLTRIFSGFSSFPIAVRCHRRRRLKWFNLEVNLVLCFCCLLNFEMVFIYDERKSWIIIFFLRNVSRSIKDFFHKQTRKKAKPENARELRIQRQQKRSSEELSAEVNLTFMSFPFSSAILAQHRPQSLQCAWARSKWNYSEYN